MHARSSIDNTCIPRYQLIIDIATCEHDYFHRCVKYAEDSISVVNL